MPTSYTAPLEERDVTFEEFVWRCARGMGAFMAEREESLDKLPSTAPIPPDTGFCDQALAEANAKLIELSTMTPEEAEKIALAEHAEYMERFTARRTVRAVQRARHEAMITEVEAWPPPTRDHVPLKEFMLQQLRLVLPSYEERAPDDATPGAVWLQDRRESAKREIEYNQKRRAEIIARTIERNDWVYALAKSVPPPIDPRTRRKVIPETLPDDGDNDLQIPRLPLKGRG